MAPLIPVVLLAGAPYLLTNDSPYGNALPIVILFSILVSYMGAYAFGLPTIHYLRKAGKLNFLNVIGAGAIWGAVIFSAFLFGFGLLMDNTIATSLLNIGWIALATGGAFGICVAISFAFISGIPRRSPSTRTSSNT